MTIAAERYNNPGDVSLPISGWTGGGKIANDGKGISGQKGYAEFETMQIGFEAFQQRLRTYILTGLPPRHGPMHNIRAIGAFYATDPHWPVAISELSKIPIGATLDIENAEEMAALAAAIIRQETGKTLAQLGIHSTPGR